MHSCEVCNAKVHELRRGRCWGCYSRWVDAKPVGVGATCVTCNEKRRRLLKSVELFGGWKPMCFSCSGQILHLDPLPTTITGLKDALSRERRRKDRRFGKPDSRVFRYERRVGDRRENRVTELAEDDLVIEITVDGADDGMDFEDMTQIRELVRDLRPVSLVG
jgi:hypothetical protein